MDGSRHQMPMTYCPACKAELDGATNMDDQQCQPVPGDLSVCAYCGEIVEFMEKLELRSATPQALAEMDIAERAMLKHMQRVIRERNKRATRH